MRKLTIAVTPAFVLALALGAMAQEKPITTNKENKDTLRASVSGVVDLSYVWRSQEITGFTSSVAGATAATSAGENTFEGYLAVRMDVDLNDKVAAVVEFGTKRVDGGAILQWGNTTANLIQLREANVTVSDFLTQGLKLGVGISSWTFDVQGKGSSTAFDPHHSQSFGRAANLKTTSDGAGTLAARAGAPEELEPVGFWLSWSNQQITLDLVALPAAIENGPASADEAFYAVDFWYHMDSMGKGSKFGAIIAVTSLAPTSTDVFTIGAGADLRMMDGNLDLFAELYFQFGNAGTNIAGTAADQTAKAKGMAFNLGATYTIPNNPIWFGLKYTFFSGDKDAAPNKNVNSFLSYENINDLMIIEDMYLGLDWDTNYWAVKLHGGFAMSLGSGKENLRLSAIVGLTRTNKDVLFAAANGGNTKNLGDEVDIKAEWVLTKQASLNLGIGFLFSSEVLENSMSAAGASTSKADKNAIEYLLGAMLKF